VADEDGRARARMIARRIEVGRAAMGAGDYELAELIFREAARRFESTKLARLADEAHAMAVARQQRDPDAAPAPLPATGSITRKPDSIVAQVEPTPKPPTWTAPATGRVIPGSSSGWPTDTSGEPRTAPPPQPKAASVSKAWLLGGLALVVVLIAIAWSGLRGSTTSLPQTVAKNRVDLPPGATQPPPTTTTPAPTTTTPAPITTPPPTTTTPAPTTTVPAPITTPPPTTTTVPKPRVVPTTPENAPTPGRGDRGNTSGTGVGGRVTRGTVSGTDRLPVVPPPPPERPPDDPKKELAARREEQRAAANQELVLALQSETAGDFPAALSHLERARQLDPSVADFAQLVNRVKTRMKNEATEAIKRARQYDALDRVSQAIAEYERAKRNLLDDDPDKKTVNERLDALRARPR
jgi:tetratricopeptide (TPR) repeat protein